MSKLTKKQKMCITTIFILMSAIPFLLGFSLGKVIYTNWSFLNIIFIFVFGYFSYLLFFMALIEITLNFYDENRRK